jgi:eukaryotic-like serine/threonine-protein kinase
MTPLLNTVTLARILHFSELPYTVQDLFHCSGQRTVYLGTNTGNDNKIVIKVCKHVEAQVARIQREFKILQSFDSPYFPQVEKYAYVTKEYLKDFLDSFNPREDKELLEELQREKIPPFFLTVEEFIEHQVWSDLKEPLKSEPDLILFMCHVFTALEMLCQAKIVHRDIKPDNLLVRPDGTPVLIDLGIAKSLGTGTVALTATFFRSPCTPTYASPEQLQGSKDISYKSDQFSFGVLLYELLTDKLPYGDINEIGEEAVVRRMIENERICLTDISTGISTELASLIDRLLETEPYKRFRNVKTILDELTRIRGER